MRWGCSVFRFCDSDASVGLVQLFLLGSGWEAYWLPWRGNTAQEWTGNSVLHVRLSCDVVESEGNNPWKLKWRRKKISPRGILKLFCKYHVFSHFSVPFWHEITLWYLSPPHPTPLLNLMPPFYQLTACLLISMATQQAVAFLIPLAVGVPGMCLGSSKITKGFCRE